MGQPVNSDYPNHYGFYTNSFPAFSFNTFMQTPKLVPWLRIIAYGMEENREKLEQYLTNPEKVESMISFTEEEIKKKHQRLKLEAKLEVAQALLSDGMDYEKVKKLTGLTDEELKAGERG